MGGRICLETYAHFPDRIATLTLEGVHASFGEFTEGGCLVGAHRNVQIRKGCTNRLGPLAMPIAGGRQKNELVGHRWSIPDG